LINPLSLQPIRIGARRGRTPPGSCVCQSAQTVLDTTGSPEDIARQTLALYFEPDRGVVPKQGEIDVKGFGQVIQIMVEAGELKPPSPPPERFIDLQYLKAAGLQ
jgi:hypothetical protein